MLFPRIKNELNFKNTAYRVFEEKNYPVNFYVWFRFNYASYQEHTPTTIKVNKDKKGQIAIIETDRTSSSNKA